MTTPAPDTVRIYRDSLGEWRWTRRTHSGATVSEANRSHPTRTATRDDVAHHNPDTARYLVETART
ncbi:hypothetical protein C7T36_18395 [Rhodococcus sp. AD45-ID]|uniref:hypothetical protein n=1 Tax=unclassified Rhodococcus (in: high G+C Gram-positive bacteria) TaxID=192944 RepID=UPI0005D45D42|nr:MULTISPECIES: hypothetical protein [unclassified Rhodococcus (in: high G+C Gram-positive bacteria)]KJF21951.1 hypothetical protein SZ00_02595 [Rhodococcus sp. AD45]PSR39648.1 hypothetical protein C7T36_18395 [Rhodococcus sp. AD45-ID]